MIGRNTIKMNHATLCAAVDLYLNTQRNPELARLKVVGVTVARLTAATALLERVRAAHDALPAEPRLDQWLEFGDAIGAALASQPEAPVKHKAWCAQMTMVARKCDCQPQELKGAAALASQPEVVLDPMCTPGTIYAVNASQPEAPKDDYEPSAQTMAVMGWTPEAPKGQEEECCSDPYECWKELQGDLAAAKAKIAEQDKLLAKLLLERNQARDVDLVRASARADAAERGNDEGTKLLTAMTAERNQLAARVTQLESELEDQHTLKPMQLCTPDERKVLEACEGLSYAAIHHWQRSEWHWCRKFAEAELANRAAKAKRGDCSGCGSTAQSCAALAMPALKCCPDCSHAKRGGA